jgi:RHS repeat-associated protein
MGTDPQDIASALRAKSATGSEAATWSGDLPSRSSRMARRHADRSNHWRESLAFGPRRLIEPRRSIGAGQESEGLVGVMWFGRAGVAVERGRFARAETRLALGGVVLLLAFLALVLVPAGASAEPLCTDTWTGGSTGTWQTASNWSTGKVPTSADVACVGAGVTVEVSSGANAAAVLENKGTLVLSRGSLELAGALEESTAYAFTVSGGTLKGAAKLDVSSSLSWTEGTMEGSGSTVLGAAASGTIRAVSTTLSERRLVNEGTLTLAAGSLELANGAVFTNGGTFNLNDNEKGCGECFRTGLEKGSGSSSFVNTGTVKKAAGAEEVGIAINTENLGTINGKTGTIAFTGGSSSVLGNSSVLEGVIKIASASVTGDSFKGTGGELKLSSGTLSMTEGNTATISGLVMAGGTLTGAGTLKVAETLSWPEGAESTMSGSGSTVLLSGASGSIAVSGGDYANLAKRALVNEGALTLASGHISLSEEAKLENRGTFKVNSEATGAIGLAPGGSGKLVNSGTVEKSSGTGVSQVSVPFESSGTAEAQKGQLAFTDGGSSTSTGKWGASEGASIKLAGGSFTLTGSSWSGAIDLSGASITAEGLHDSSSVPVSIQAGSLSIVGATASTISDLSLTGGTLSGAGTLKVNGSLEWTGEGGVMSGSGSTILEPGATGKIEVITPAVLQQRSLVNGGTLTWASGAIFLEEGAQISSSGVFYANDNGSSCGGGCRGTGIDPGTTGSGTFENTGSVVESAGSEAQIEVGFDNQGSVKANTGKLKFRDGGISGHTAAGSWSATGGSTAIEFTGGSFTWGSTISIAGAIIDAGATITAADVQGSGEVNLQLKSGLLTLNGPSVSHVTELQILHPGGKLAGAGNLNISGSLLWNEGNMEGIGQTVLEEKATGTLEDSNLHLIRRTLVNEGRLNWISGALILGEQALFQNRGVFLVSDEKGCEECATGISPEKWGYPGETGESKGVLLNEGLIEKTAGPTTYVEVPTGNYGVITEPGGKIDFTRRFYEGPEAQWGGSENQQEPALCGEEESVGCATGNYSQTQADFSIGGQGVGLNLSRTYNAQAAAAGVKSIFGYGWSSSFSDHLVGETAKHIVQLVQADGSTITFNEGSGESFTAPEWTQDTLSGSSSSGYTLTLENQTVYKFSGAGRLESVTDRNGNATTLAYNGSGNLETITDPVGRKIKLAYNSEGFVESAEDPMKHVVKYTYESGNLATVSQPGESALRWQFKYDGSHRMFETTDGRGGKATIEYNGLNQVVSQTDPAKRTTSYEYTAFYTKMTNHATGDVKVQYFTSNGVGTSLTNGYGTSSATTETDVYNAADELLSVTDGNGHITRYGYDSHDNRTSAINPDSDETKWEYNSTHDVVSTTTPNGETTTIKRDSHGNPEVIERPAPGGKTQITKYKYGSHGEVESMIDPLEHTWKYEYDSYGDRTAEIDPEGNKRTWEYNEDSQETGMVSPRGHVKAGEEEKYRTKTERDAQGRPIKTTDPLSHVTEYKYDGDGNVEKMTDANKHTTTYTYDADNERTKVEAPNKAVTEEEYDGAGQVITESDGDKHKIKYKRNVIEQVIEVADPLGHVTTKEYDGAGNLVKVVDPTKRTTTYTYDGANRLTEIGYSSGKPATVKYEYDKDGNRTKMIDGTGTSKYVYDQLDRLTESESGHKEIVKYEYDVANDQVKLTYPGGKEVTRAFDKDRRLEKITDWLKHETKFTYDQDSEAKATVFPSETKDEDSYTYNDADQMTEVKMLKGAETLASLVYTRDNDNQVKKTTGKGVPGSEVTEATYDENNRVTKYGTAEYKYDAANNPTKEPSSENTYNEGDELEKGTGVTYSYDELGERTKAKPATGPATTYGYDQAGELTSVERPKEGETVEIKDSYEYNGQGLRTSQVINGTTTYMTWDMAEELPLILSDGTNSYIYGPGGYPVEQVNNTTGTVLYLHHDQQDSTRLITGHTGTVEGKCTYGAYGTSTCEGSATTPFGFDGQYTNGDTGLIYLRARYYDPATAQFLTVDPALTKTHESYVYVADGPLTSIDPTGECAVARTAARDSTAEECKQLRGSIEVTARNLEKRLRQLQENKRGLSAAEVKNYIKTFEDKQQALRKKLKKWNFKNCSEEIGETIPAEVWQLTEIKVKATIKIVPVPVI